MFFFVCSGNPEVLFEGAGENGFNHIFCLSNNIISEKDYSLQKEPTSNNYRIILSEKMFRPKQGGYTQPVGTKLGGNIGPALS